MIFVPCSPLLQDVVDDPFFEEEARSPAGAQRTKEGIERAAQIAALGTDDSFPETESKESLFDRIAAAPLTLWTIPEISSVGLTEEQCLQQGMKKANHGGSL